MKRCLLDLDGVLVDFVGGACSLHKRSNPYTEGFAHFYLEQAWGITPTQFWSGMDREFWANLPWMPDGRAIFEIIHNRYGPANTCILTSPSSNDGCFDGKIDWIRRHLPPEYHRRFLMGPVKDFCAHPDHVLIDDRDENHDGFVAAGGCAIIVPRPWNHMRSLVKTSAPDYIEARFSDYDKRPNRRDAGSGKVAVRHTT